MAKADKTYRVVHGFYAVTKEKEEGRPKKQYFTRGNQHLVTELLTEKTIKAFVESGSLAESTSLEDALGTAPNPVELSQENS